MRKGKGAYLKRNPLYFRVMTVAVMAAAALLLSMTAFAQTTYVITDGSRVLIHTCHEPDGGSGRGGTGTGNP